MKGILIREAKKSDLPGIEQLAAELVEAMDDTAGIGLSLVHKNCRDLLSDAHSYLLVAEIKGVIVGFIHLATRRTVLHRGLSGFIDELVITRDYRGQGIGKQLISSAIEKCRQLGCCEVEVSAEKTNSKARGFYKRCGFKERGILLEIDLESC